ncbi:ZF-HD homeobox protein [Iris pallida]|uniref:ZF-HD homeobox protein n=1 Tax=Iris pallida TaxID=29817 RepID=A0AAX6E782_IRIPA|nr:ZF-HD homeobox protein [Iris pallida]
MDQFRSSGGGEAKEADGSRAPFSPPSSAFSRPILPASSTLLLPPKPLGGAPNGTTSSGPAPDPAADSAGRYRECLRNHAASIGGHVVDGCGEFMPAGPGEPMKCAACGCHRSFHRREPEPVSSSSNLVRVPLLLPPPPPHPHGPRAFGFGCSGNATTESSSEERNAHHSHSHDAAAAAAERGKKKRFRTKFSSEQKEKMTAFAERVEWRVQRKDDAEMERFCREIGVTRQVLKVWMHNNKHLVKKHHHQQQQAVDQPQQEQQHNQPQQQQEEAIAEKNAVAR